MCFLFIYMEKRSIPGVLGIERHHKSLSGVFGRQKLFRSAETGFFKDLRRDLRRDPHRFHGLFQFDRSRDTVDRIIVEILPQNGHTVSTIFS